MKFFTRVIMVPVVPALFYLTIPQTADAYNLESGSSSLHLIAALLVGGLFAANHFRDRIKSFYRNLVSRVKNVKEPKTR